MNKCEFLGELEKSLSELPEKDRSRSLDYYGEMIDDRTEEGLSEEEAVQALGSMEDITAQILMDTPLPSLVRAKVKKRRALKAWETVLLVLGSPVWLPLLIAAVAVALSLYAVLWVLVAVLYIVAFAFGLSAAACLVAAFAYLFSGAPAAAALSLGAAMLCAGFAILTGIASVQSTKGVIAMTKKLIRKIKSGFVK